MNDTEGPIAIVSALYHQAKGEYIHDVAKGSFLGAHLLVDAPQVLFATFNQCGECFAFQAYFNGLLNLAENFFTIFSRRFHGFAQASMTQGIHGSKAKVFELKTNIVDTQTLCDGGINL